MTITEKDQKQLINTPNKALADNNVARVYIDAVPEAILKFYEANADKINGEVVVVRSNADAGFAANRRNNAPKILFLFGKEYWPDAYFTGVANKLRFKDRFFIRYSMESPM